MEIAQIEGDPSAMHSWMIARFPFRFEFGLKEEEKKSKRFRYFMEIVSVDKVK